MSITIDVPSALRRFTDDQGRIAVEAQTVGDALRSATDRHPRLRRQLYGTNGHIRGFIKVYLNARDIRQLQGEVTPVSAGDSIILVPAIAGG